MKPTTKHELTDHFYALALEAIADENYYIINDGGFTDEDFANAATNIFRGLLTYADPAWVLKKEPISIIALGLDWKVKNGMPGFISCSDDNRTGVSRKSVYILRYPYGLEVEDVKEVLDMMNEAWFHMQYIS